MPDIKSYFSQSFSEKLFVGLQLSSAHGKEHGCCVSYFFKTQVFFDLQYEFREILTCVFLEGVFS